MAVVYEHCSEDVEEVADELIKKYHSDLRDKGKPVAIEYVFAELEPDSNGDRPSGYAVKLHGRGCYAVAKIIGAKDRALGGKDARITIDKSQWEKMPMPKRRALIDHELNHFIVKRDGGGTAILDAYERPRLRIRPHDHEFGWFMVIAQRHSTNSIEVEQAQRMADDAGKLYFQSEFTFAEAPDPYAGTLSIQSGNDETIAFPTDQLLSGDFTKEVSKKRRAA